MRTDKVDAEHTYPYLDMYEHIIDLRWICLGLLSRTLFPVRVCEGDIRVPLSILDKLVLQILRGFLFLEGHVWEWPWHGHGCQQRPTIERRLRPILPIVPASSAPRGLRSNCQLSLSATRVLRFHATTAGRLQPPFSTARIRKLEASPISARADFTDDREG